MNSVYRQMAFKVHPDVSGNTEATEMMKAVNANKHNPAELIKLAAKWGLDINIPENLKATFDRAKESAHTHNRFYREESARVYEAVLNAVVKWHYTYHFKRRMGYGVISKVRKIKKGKFAGYTEWTVLDLVTGSEKKIKKIHNPFIVEKMASSDMTERAWDLINEHKRVAKATKQDKKKFYNEKFEIFGLRANHNYQGEGWRVSIRYKGGAKSEELIKTTNFCVFHKSGFTGRTRRTDLKFVNGAEKTLNTYA